MWKQTKTTGWLRLGLAAVALTGLVACSGASSPLSAGGAQTVSGAQIETSPLLGTWDVSLFFSADAAPSATQMVVTAVGEDGTLSGTFYGSPFETGRFTEFQGETRFTVVTSDGTGPYITSGILSGEGTIQGQTLATGREFLMAWTAERG